MKKLPFAIVGAAALALAACGGQGDDALGDNVEETNAATEDLNAMAIEADDTAESDALANQAEALEAETPATEPTADVDASAVNAM